MKFNNIVTKLWIVMTILVLVVIGISGAVQTSFMEGLYFDQQARQLKSLGNKVAEIAKAEQNSTILDSKVAMIANLYNANIMLLDDQGIVRHCQGLGISTTNMPMDMNNPHHGPLSEDDLQKLYKGQTVVLMGTNQFFKTEVLSVGIPFKESNKKNWAIIIHAPLRPLASELVHFQMLIIYTAVGGIILAALLSLIFSRIISKPLVKMNLVALEMASGNYRQRVDIHSKDEIGLLAGSLNTLSSRLLEKISQLEAQEQIRREFVTNVAHEIKTPLAIIQGFTETMLDGLVKNEMDRETYLGNILDEVNRLKRLVTEILDLKRMEEGHFNYDKQPCNLKILIEGVLSKLNLIILQKGINLEVNLEKRLPNIICDNDRMERVFINLIDNAILHTPTGGKITLQVTNKANQVQIHISDTGCGIPQEDLPMIWERFYKVDKSRNRNMGGTGLGLAIVKRIVEGHGGHINVESIVNVGTTFTIVLPISNNSV